jgi:hypothetical protein
MRLKASTLRRCQALLAAYFVLPGEHPMGRDDRAPMQHLEVVAPTDDLDDPADELDRDRAPLGVDRDEVVVGHDAAPRSFELEARAAGERDEEVPLPGEAIDRPLVGGPSARPSASSSPPHGLFGTVTVAESSLVLPDPSVAVKSAV